MSEQGDKNCTTGEWKREASLLRTSGVQGLASRGMQYAPWQQAAVTMLLVVCLGGAIYLLIAKGHRHQLVASFVNGLEGELGSPFEPDIYRLPAPPPRTLEPKVVRPAREYLVDEDDDTGFVFEGEEDPAQQAAEDKPPTPPMKTEEFQQAHELLLALSATAAEVTEGGIEGLSFKEWNPVGRDGPRLLIELVAVSGSGAEERLIWSVNPETNRIRALSQAARDLESRTQ
jgi:hypothetical protein